MFGFLYGSHPIICRPQCVASTSPQAYKAVEVQKHSEDAPSIDALPNAGESERPNLSSADQALQVHVDLPHRLFAQTNPHALAD